MRRATPTVLALAGVAAVVAGAGVAMAFAVAQTSCQDGSGLVPNPGFANHCNAEAWGARIGFIVLVLGGLLVLVAGIRATPRYGGGAGSPAPALDDGGPGGAATVAPGENPQGP